MKKNINLFSSLVMALCFVFAFSFAGCSLGSQPSEPKKVDVTFSFPLYVELDGEYDITQEDSQNVLVLECEYGEMLELPMPIEYDDVEFIGWYTTTNGKVTVNDDKITNLTRFTKDTDVVAVFENQSSFLKQGSDNLSDFFDILVCEANDGHNVDPYEDFNDPTYEKPTMDTNALDQSVSGSMIQLIGDTVYWAKRNEVSLNVLDSKNVNTGMTYMLEMGETEGEAKTTIQDVDANTYAVWSSYSFVVDDGERTGNRTSDVVLIINHSGFKVESLRIIELTSTSYEGVEKMDVLLTTTCFNFENYKVSVNSISWKSRTEVLLTNLMKQPRILPARANFVKVSNVRASIASNNRLCITGYEFLNGEIFNYEKVLNEVFDNIFGGVDFQRISSDVGKEQTITMTETDMNAIGVFEGAGTEGSVWFIKYNDVDYYIFNDEYSVRGND